MIFCEDNSVFPMTLEYFGLISNNLVCDGAIFGALKVISGRFLLNAPYVLNVAIVWLWAMVFGCLPTRILKEFLLNVPIKPIVFWLFGILHQKLFLGDFYWMHTMFCFNFHYLLLFFQKTIGCHCIYLIIFVAGWVLPWWSFQNQRVSKVFLMIFWTLAWVFKVFQTDFKGIPETN